MRVVFYLYILSCGPPGSHHLKFGAKAQGPSGKQAASGFQAREWRDKGMGRGVSPVPPPSRAMRQIMCKIARIQTHL
eukprot:scaffold15662_cov109-Isochrysis_galbana.AAC.12